MTKYLLIVSLIFSNASYAGDLCEGLFIPSKTTRFFKKPPTFHEKEYLGGVIRKDPLEHEVSRFKLVNEVTRFWLRIRNRVTRGYEFRPIMALVDFLFDRPIAQKELMPDTPPAHYWARLKLPNLKPIYLFPKQDHNRPYEYRMWYKFPVYLVLAAVIGSYVDDGINAGTELSWDHSFEQDVKTNQAQLLQKMRSDFRHIHTWQMHRQKKLDDNGAAKQVLLKQLESVAVFNLANAFKGKKLDEETVEQFLNFSTFDHINDLKLDYKKPQDKEKLERLIAINIQYLTRDAIVRSYFDDKMQFEQYKVYSPYTVKDIFESFYFVELNQLFQNNKLSATGLKLALQEIEYWKKVATESPYTGETIYVDEQIKLVVQSAKKIAKVE